MYLAASFTMQPQQILTEFADFTTIHGLRNWILSGRLTKRYVMPFLSVLIIGGFAYQTVSLLLYTKPIVAHLSSNHHSRYDYPNIRFCPRRWLNETKVKMLNNENAILFALSLLTQVKLRKNISVSLSSAEAALRNYMTDKNLTDFLQVYPTLAYDAENIFRCTGCKKAVATPVATSEGVCYDFHFKRLVSDNYDKYPKAAFTYFIQPGRMYGHVYAAHYFLDTLYINQEDRDFFGYDPIFISPYSFVVITLKPMHRKRLPTSDEPCFTDEQLESRKYPSAKMCYADCRAWLVAPICRGSVSLGYFQPKSDRMTPNLFTSLNDSRETQTLLPCYQRLRPMLEPCYNQCMPRCNRIAYDVQMETFHSTETVVLRNKEKNTNMDFLSEVRKKFKKLEDGVEDRKGTTIAFLHSIRNGMMTAEEISTRSGDMLISNLGGLISLWTGASALSLTQAVIYLIRWIAAKRKSRVKEEVTKEDDTEDDCVVAHL